MEIDQLNWPTVPDRKLRGRGRPVLESETLAARRDSLVGLFSSWWAEIGWQLTRATTREELRQAFEPLPQNLTNQVAPFVRPTSVIASGKDIRAARKAHIKPVERLHELQSIREACSKACQEAEWALHQAKLDQIELVRRAISKRRADYERAESELQLANDLEKRCEEHIFDCQAGFAQEELLKFIKKRFIEGSYARNPLNLANAMAGLPYHYDEPFLGVWYSYARCSKLESDQWPNLHFQVFEELERIWKRYQGSSSSTLPTEFFRQQIRALPNTTKKMTNLVRSHLVETWVDLQLAIEKSVASPPDDPNRMPFVIGTSFAKTKAEPKSFVDKIIADAPGIDD
jgi:hypothetical protein